MTECYENSGRAQRLLAEFRLEAFNMDVKNRNEVLEKAIEIAHNEVVDE